jgi:uncharacterized protein YbjT (DUF2867 family)
MNVEVLRRLYLQEGETNINSLKDNVAVVTDAMYVIVGASGNTGSIIANSLLLKGEKVRVMGRDAGRLQRFVRKGAEAFTAELSDAAAFTKAFSGARAAYLMLPPVKSREDQERQSDAIAKAVKESGLRYAVHLSSFGAQVPEGAGPIAGLHSSEQKLNAIRDLNVLHLRAGYFMENQLAAISMIHGMGMFGGALPPDLKLPMIATRDIGAYAAQRLLDLDFSGKQTRELLGERDLSMTEATAVIARGIGKPELRYEQFPYDQVQQVLTQMGIPPKTAAEYIEMYKAINAGVLAAQEPRSPENSSPTSFERFVQDVLAPAYHGKVPTA